MSGIAEVLLNLGYQVSGSDQKRSAVTDRLATLGARIYEGHAASNVAEAQVVVTSTAVKADNPEVMQARRQGLPVIPRAEMLAELMRLKYGVAVAGSHGKTTTTSMVAMVLDKGGLDPTVVVGGRVGTLGSGAKLGKGEFMVAEADESDRSFLKLTPTVAVVTNIDREHLDTYKDLADVQEAFLNFVNKVPFYGAAVLCLDDPAVQDILPRVERRIVTYGVSRQAEVTARDVVLGPMGSTYTACSGDAVLGTIELPVPGHHNVLNSLAAVAVGLDLGVSFAAVKEGLAVVHRRGPPLPAPRRGRRRHRDRRLRPPPDGDPRHPRDPARPRGHPPHRRPVPAPPLHPHPAPVGRLLPRLPPGRPRRASSTSTPRGRSRSQGITSETLADAIGRKGHRHVVYGGDMRAAVEHLRGGGPRRGRRPHPRRGQRVDRRRRAAPAPRRGRSGGRREGVERAPGARPTGASGGCWCPRSSTTPWPKATIRLSFAPSAGRGSAASAGGPTASIFALQLSAVAPGHGERDVDGLLAGDGQRAAAGGQGGGARQPVPLRRRGPRAPRPRGGREHPEPRHRLAEGAPPLLAVGGRRHRHPHPARHPARRGPASGCPWPSPSSSGSTSWTATGP